MPARRPAFSVHVTPREVEVLNLLAQGLANEEIGLALRMATRTVKGHIHKLAAKLQVNSERTGPRIHSLRLSLLQYLGQLKPKPVCHPTWASLFTLHCGEHALAIV